MTRSRAVFLGLAVAMTIPAHARGQEPLTLDALQGAAVRHDPRALRGALEDSASALRIDAIRTGWMPGTSLLGNGMWQSEVTNIAGSMPGLEVPLPPRERYQMTLRVDQLLFDGGELGGRRAIEESRLARSRADLETELYGLRLEVNAAFFRALIFEERLAEMDALIADLESRMSLVRARVEEGAALPGDSALVLAEVLSARQERLGLERLRDAELAVLERLTGESIATSDRLAAPSLAARVDSVRGLAGLPRARPEFESFSRARQAIESQRGALGTALGPRVSAFAEGGIGRPGLDIFNLSPHGFAMAGIQLRWSPFDWGGTRHNQEALTVEQRVVDLDEAALEARLDRDTRRDLAEIDRLSELLETDGRVVTLRELVERQALAQLEEGTITASDYIERRTELLRARLALRQHRVELAGAHAGYLTTLGLGVQ